MKNRKIMLIFIAIVMIIMAIAPVVYASNEEGLPVIETNEDLNNSNTDNNQASNNENTNNNAVLNANTDASTENKLPQTGVAEDTTLFVFIAVCILSAIYAYKKVRDYRNI